MAQSKRHPNHDHFVEEIITSRKNKDLGRLEHVKHQLRQLPKEEADAIQKEAQAEYSRRYPVRPQYFR